MIPYDHVIMAESSSPFSKPISGEQKPIMSGKNNYSSEEWSMLNDKFGELRKTIDLGTRGAVVQVTKYLCSLEYRIPYANYEYQQRYDKAYAVYPYPWLNPDWGKPFVRDNGKKLPAQGLYCSALVEWAFINGGVSFEGRITTDARTYHGTVMKAKKAFTLGLIQPGDTIHTSQRKSSTGRMYNHIGIVLEVLADGVLVAEERPMRGLQVTKVVKFSRLDTVVVNSTLYR